MLVLGGLALVFVLFDAAAARRESATARARARARRGWRRSCSARSSSRASTSGPRRSRPGRSPRSWPDATGWARACSASRSRRSSTPLLLLPLALDVGVAAARAAGGRRLRGDLRRGRARAASCRSSSSRRTECWDALTRQTNRPLQIETLGAGVLLVLHQVAGIGLTMQSSHGSQNLAGAGPDALAAFQTVLQLRGDRLGLGLVLRAARPTVSGSYAERPRSSSAPSSRSERCSRRSS